MTEKSELSNLKLQGNRLKSKLICIYHDASCICIRHFCSFQISNHSRKWWCGDENHNDDDENDDDYIDDDDSNDVVDNKIIFYSIFIRHMQCVHQTYLFLRNTDNPISHVVLL